MKTQHYAAAVAALLVASHVVSNARADSFVAPVGVTLQLCGDVNAEDVQLALAVEYQQEDLGNTMLTVRCQGDKATLRIVGPSHPRGRIADVDLEGIAPVARSRTIAVLAAELWTAPEPAAPAVPVPTVRVTRNPELAKAPQLAPRYRGGLHVGVAVLQSSRTISAQRFEGTFGARGSFSSIAVEADYQVAQRLGFFASASVSAPTNMGGNPELQAAVRWRRTEVGAYVPLWRKRLRVDLRFSFGTDTLTAQGVYQRNSTRVLLPRYTHGGAGLDIGLAINAKSSLVATAITQVAASTDDEFRGPTGARWNVGYRRRLYPQVHALATFESSWLTARRPSGPYYQDRISTLNLGLRYVH